MTEALTVMWNIWWKNSDRLTQARACTAVFMTVWTKAKTGITFPVNIKFQLHFVIRHFNEIVLRLRTKNRLPVYYILTVVIIKEFHLLQIAFYLMSKCSFRWRLRSGMFLGRCGHWLHWRGRVSRCLASCWDIVLTLPASFSCLMTDDEERKYPVVKEFQCFLCFRQSDTKSRLMTWRWSCDIEGTAW